MHQSFSSSDDSQLDFATLLEQSFESEFSKVEKGDLLTGIIVAIDNQGMILDVGLKRDGVIPRHDLEALDDEMAFEIGQEITVMVVQPEDYDGNLVVSINQARASKDWTAALGQMEDNEIHCGTVVASNEGGLIVPYGQLRGFIPASHVIGLPRGLDSEERAQQLATYVGQELELQIIEVNPRRRRLVLSQREAQRQLRDHAKESLMESLSEGDVIKGKVSSLRDFGAFVNLGGADGLIHVSELSWSRVRHPGEILNVGMEIDAYVLQLDRDNKRIGLSLKRLQPNPWEAIARDYQIGQSVAGKVTRVVTFGAFLELEYGIEALLHVSEISSPPPANLDAYVQPGDTLTTRIISLDPRRQRIGLSLIGVDNQEGATEAVMIGEAAPVSEGK